MVHDKEHWYTKELCSHQKDTRHMQTTAHRLTSLWTTVRTQLRDGRDAHAARTVLERELASYNTPEDLNDLHAILDRHSDSETADIRRILASQRSASN
jgi:hypothetical protein